MILYLDLISHEGMFSNIHNIQEITDRLCLEVDGKVISWSEGDLGGLLIGEKASAEGPEGEGTKSTVVTGVAVITNHHLQETRFTKEAYKKYIKDYMKLIKGKLEGRVKTFISGAAEPFKYILVNFKNYQFFAGENMNADGMGALWVDCEDGVTL